MYTSEKTRFIVESLVKTTNKHSVDFRKSSKKLLKHMEDSADYGRIADLIKEAIDELAKTMGKWEDTSCNELDGLTPKQYFETLGTFDEIIGLFTLLEEKNDGIFPKGLEERVKMLDDAFESDLLKVIESMDLDESKCLNSTQKAVLHIVEILANPQFVNALLKIVSQLDDEKSDEESFTGVMDVMRAIGEPVLSPLIELLENDNKRDRLYLYLILTIAKIASGNRSERIYSMLKDFFRKSENKYVEASALAIYGDGRAIPAIRGYVEKNHEILSYWEYVQFRDAILLLGGIVSDLDEYFYDYEDYDE